MWKRFILLLGLLPLSACAKADILNFTITRDGYAIHRDLAYGELARQKLDIYVPEKLSAPAPVIVFYYGGSWQSGSKKDYLFVGQALASKGYVVVIADYRLYPEVYFPEFMQDSAKAFAWVHANIAQYQGDARNLYVAGHSAGAYNALMLSANREYLSAAGAKPEWVRGTIGIAGPYDFLPFTDPNIIALFSKKPDTETQPITYLRAGMAPVFLATGDADVDVYPRNTQHVEKRLKELGSVVETHYYPGVEHVGIVLSLAEGFRGKAPLREDIAAFVERTKAK